ncbi:MAG TPA: nucleotide exchange factor GrpE [Anaerolineales bacterium]|nr:nucleotide exchange factor GrpE [Anaerolineales bacterium]
MSEKKAKSKNEEEILEETLVTENESPSAEGTLDDLKARLIESDAKVQELMDALQRERADFLNYRRRTDQEKMMAGQYASGEVIRKLLAGIDDLERALSHKREGDCSWAEGVELVYRKFINILEIEGVKKIEAEGKEFDPQYHEALMQEAADGVESGIVTAVLLPGYTHKDRVLRPAQVKVAQ